MICVHSLTHSINFGGSIDFWVDVFYSLDAQITLNYFEQKGELK